MNQPQPGSISVAALLPLPNCAELAPPSADLTAEKPVKQIMQRTDIVVPARRSLTETYTNQT